MPIFSFSCASAGAAIIAIAAVAIRNLDFIFISLFLPFGKLGQQVPVSGQTSARILRNRRCIAGLLRHHSCLLGRKNGSEPRRRHSLQFQEMPVEIGKVGKAHIVADLRHFHVLIRQQHLAGKINAQLIAIAHQRRSRMALEGAGKGARALAHHVGEIDFLNLFRQMFAQMRECTVDAAIANTGQIELVTQARQHF